MSAPWLDRTLYPFEHRYVELDRRRLHYIDEGAGDPIVFVHGTPAWSFVWRHLIRDLRNDYRCIALDHLGFGLSEKPENAGYTPADHARNFEAFIQHLGVEDITLVVHDFGGPIGLPYAIEHPDRVKRIVLTNTWLWPNHGSLAFELGTRVVSGPIGSFLYKRLNFSPKFLLRMVFADKSKLSQTIHDHYLAPFPTAAQRVAPWILAREFTGSNEWYEAAWRKRDALNDTPMLILWGMADKLIPPSQLVRWQEAFPQAEVVRFDDVGHFVAEEAPQEASEAIRSFLRASSSGSARTPPWP